MPGRFNFILVLYVATILHISVKVQAEAAGYQRAAAPSRRWNPWESEGSVSQANPEPRGARFVKAKRIYIFG